MEPFHGTTIVSVRRGNAVAMGGDGQVTLGNIVVKADGAQGAAPVPRPVLAGFAGATADAFTLFERFEAKLEKHQGHLVRSAVELAKDWRTDRVLRRLEAMLAVADREASLIITGNGDVLEPELRAHRHRLGRSLCAGGGARAARHTELAPRDIVKKAARASPAICASTRNQSHTIETLGLTRPRPRPDEATSA